MGKLIDGHPCPEEIRPEDYEALDTLEQWANGVPEEEEG